MPKKSIDYLNQDVYFYKLVCKDLEIKDVYVGSTMNMTKRLHSHKNMCKNQHRKEFNYPVYIRIRDSGGFGNWSMVLIEKLKCDDAITRAKRERELVEELKANLNANIPGRTASQWYNDNKDMVRNNHKLYYENNKENVLAKCKEWYENNKEHVLAKCKAYYENHKDNVKTKSKEYYEKHRDVINSKRKHIYHNHKKLDMIKSIVEITLARVVYDILNSYEFSETTDQSELSENEYSE